MIQFSPCYIKSRSEFIKWNCESAIEILVPIINRLSAKITKLTTNIEPECIEIFTTIQHIVFTKGEVLIITEMADGSTALQNMDLQQFSSIYSECL